ncbi:hypothetical protein G3M48_005125 [Beauveria asiatica]|uniref:Uncharacterized protein n=1 Tax=Beauveria asiatica TaxID=1069075 RepID=A0AAW0RST1_9HYPO
MTPDVTLEEEKAAAWLYGDRAVILLTANPQSCCYFMAQALPYVGADVPDVLAIYFKSALAALCALHQNNMVITIKSTIRSIKS